MDITTDISFEEKLKKEKWNSRLLTLYMLLTSAGLAAHFSTPRSAVLRVTLLWLFRVQNPLQPLLPDIFSSQHIAFTDLIL